MSRKRRDKAIERPRNSVLRYGASVGRKTFHLNVMPANEVSEMSTEVIRAITTLSAVVLGFALAQGSEWIKYQRRAASRRKAIRCLINLEASSNCASIRRFWAAMLARRSEWIGKDDAFPFVDLAQEASKVPFPPLDISAWEANLAEVASAYSEAELERMWRLQRSLHQLQSLHRFFCEASGERRESYRGACADGHSAVAMMSSGIGFTDSVANPAREFKALAEEVMAFVVAGAEPSKAVWFGFASSNAKTISEAGPSVSRLSHTETPPSVISGRV